MEELVYLKNDEAVCSSLQVAEKFGKRHADVMRSIENLVKNDSTQNCVQCFKKSTYKDYTGKSNKMYVMNRDGFTFLVMGFTGSKANEWKWQYIKAFNQMESFIREKSTQTWVETRKYGKLTRKAETDTIQKLVEYAKKQGSGHAEMLYMTYSKLANKMAGVKKRDEATVKQLNDLSLMENIILHEIDLGIIKRKHYKEIYKDCKNRLETVKDLAYLEIA
jgi:Rha family phage regulatory protein